MLEFPELKNLTELKKSKKLLRTGKEGDLPDMPGYNLLSSDPHFYYKSVNNYKLLLQKLDDD